MVNSAARQHLASGGHGQLIMWRSWRVRLGIVAVGLALRTLMLMVCAQPFAQQALHPGQNCRQCGRQQVARTEDFFHSARCRANLFLGSLARRARLRPQKQGATIGTSLASSSSRSATACSVGTPPAPASFGTRGPRRPPTRMCMARAVHTGVGQETPSTKISSCVGSVTADVYV